MPAAEPGDEQRPRRLPLPRRQAHLPEADRDLVERAARPRALRAVPALHPLLRADRRRPVHRPARARCRSSRSAPRPRCRSSPTSPATPSRSARSARSPVRRTGSGPARSTCSPPPRSASTARPVARSAATGVAAAVTRRLAGDDPEVNEEWNCDKGRWAFHYATQADRLTAPMVRDEHGDLVETNWPDALERAATGLREAVDRGGVGVLPGGPADRGGRVRVREVRPRRPRHQRHRLPGAPGSRRGVRVPRLARRRLDAGACLVRDAGEGAGGVARRLRAGGGVADRLPPAAARRRGAAGRRSGR